MIDWVEGKSTVAFTTSRDVASRHQQMDPRAMHLAARAELLHNGKHVEGERLRERSLVV